MDEYIKTLEIAASQGDQEAQQELEKSLAHQESIRKTTQRFASNLRADGVDVKYRNDGGIEFSI